MAELLEAAVVVSTVGLTYVTAYPYATRRRHAQRVRYHVVKIYGVCVHHGRLILWQLTVIMPHRHRSWWDRLLRRGEDD